MTLTQLRYVIAAADTGSMNEAAKKLFISQPSLSQALRELEKEIGIEIFLRNNRGVILTEEGKEFLGYARQVTEQYELMESRYVEKKDVKKKFAVSMQHYTFAVSAFIGMVKQFGMEEYEFAVRETTTYEVIEDVTIDLFERIYKKAFRELEEMPPEDHIDIKYEDFCKDPKGYVKLIYEHLGIDGFEEAKPYFDAYLESQKNYKKNKFELTPRLRDKINAKLGFYFEHYGYEMQK